MTDRQQYVSHSLPAAQAAAARASVAGRVQRYKLAQLHRARNRQATPGCGNRLLDLQLAFRRIKRAIATPGYLIGLLVLGQKKDGSPGPGQLGFFFQFSCGTSHSSESG